MSRSEKIPITVGIMGHNDAIITPEHQLRIEQLFKDLALRYPNSPIYLFSSITKGAGRFVAKIFLDLKFNNEELKERLELIIPMTKGVDNSFIETDREFSDLQKKAKKVIYISPDDNNSERFHSEFETMKFIADSSLIFIALWNGQNTGIRGISDVINYKITGDDKDIAKSTFEYDGTVFIMHCTRNSHAVKLEDISKNHINLSLKQVLEDNSIRHTLDKIEEINSDFTKFAHNVQPRSQSYLITNHEELTEQQRTILDIYSIFDLLSLHYHKKYNNTVIWLFIIGLFIITSFGIYTNVWLNKVMLTIAIMLIALAGGIYYYSSITKHHTKYIYNRTLAEALRIQFFWNIAGINHKVSDSILRIHRKEFIWIEHILSSVYSITYDNATITSNAVNELTVNWVKKQADYFDISIQKMTQKMAKYKIISNIAFIVAFAFLFSIFLLEKIYIENNWMNYLQVVIGTLLGVFALIRAYIQIKGYSQLLNQYELMKVLYRKAETKIYHIMSSPLDSDSRLKYLKELFFIIGTESLIENGTWYLILKDKEPGIEGI
jgi:hypothetical protein